MTGARSCTLLEDQSAAPDKHQASWSYLPAALQSHINIVSKSCHFSKVYCNLSTATPNKIVNKKQSKV
jgi:hypothetical protein